MKSWTVVAITLLFITIVACTKTVNPIVPNNPNTSSLFPIKQGNNWIYQDSVFDATQNLINSYTDSMFIKNTTVTNNGIVFTALNDSLGWFGSKGFIALSSNNQNIYALDSANAPNPYVFFASSSVDGALIGSSQDFSNPSCIKQDQLYGFATSYNIAGYNCYKNISLVKDCNGIILYTNLAYVSPGVGMVRIENYIVVPGSSSNTLYRNFSQTLIKANLVK
jgi:hypothetical protein